MSQQLARYEFHSALERSQVDPHNGIIRGVSIITSGITARGHDLEVDRKTMTQLKECADSRGTIPVKWNHKSGADAVCGYLDNFRIEGHKLLGDWHLLKTHPNFGQAIELAERMPNNIGLSAAFMGDDEKSGGRKYARCKELISVDLVSTPAANPDGLFEAKESVDTKHFDYMGNTNQNGAPAQEPTLADVLAAVQGMQTHIAEITQRMEQAEAFQQAVVEAAESDGELTEEEAEALAQQQAEAAAQQQGEGQTGEGAGQGGQSGEGTALSRRIAAIESALVHEFEAKQQADHEHLFASVNEKIELLATENEALRFALKAKGARQLSVGGHGARMFETGTIKKHQFEANVAEHVAAGKTKAQAVELSRKENPQAFLDYLAAKRIYTAAE
ncbi:MAG: hypothetical protein WCO60_18405 [Verrucomicrobiota bacterium]